MKKILLILLGFIFIHSNYLAAQITIVDTITSSGIERYYRLYIPKNYDANKACPLVFSLHGYTSNGLQQQGYSNFMPIADTAQFLLVSPDGIANNWNAGLSLTGPKDVQFISDLIDSVAIQYKIDKASVYSCGMSMGGFMSYALACALSNRIAAIASVTGTMYSVLYKNCTPNRAVPVMEIHGTADGIVPYTGNSNMTPIDTVIKYWVKNNNCISTPVFTNVPNINTTDGSTVEHYEYKAKMPGAATCELYKVIGGGHTWAGSPIILSGTNYDFNASAKIWLFFRKYKLSSSTGINETKLEPGVSIYPNPCTDNLLKETRLNKFR